MSGAGTFSSCDTIDSLAEIVKSDLEEMGYSNVMLSPTLPTIDSSQELICVRMSYADYHFMRYDIETNAWYHKPGITAILKYNTVPSEDNIWYREYSFYGSESPDAPPYDSEIVFITYNKKQIDINSDATIREYIQPNNDIFLNLNFADSEIYNFKLNSTHSVKFEIYDENFNFVEGGNGTNIDIHISIINPKYYLRVNFESYEYLDYVDISINDCPYNDHYEQYSATQHKAYCECGEYVLEDHFIAMNFCQLCDAPHTHDYSDHYIPKTNSTHISYCICGSTSIQPHVVSAGAFSSGNKYAICLACGGTATTGIILHQAIGKLPCSENGSFILPNGVIVLVDEDIEAYFDGRLEFIYPDDNLETE